jgi:hypothetical protein
MLVLLARMAGLWIGLAACVDPDPMIRSMDATPLGGESSCLTPLTDQSIFLGVETHQGQRDQRKMIGGPIRHALYRHLDLLTCQTDPTDSLRPMIADLADSLRPPASMIFPGPLARIDKLITGTLHQVLI